LDQARTSKTPILLATACRCHAVINTFSISAGYKFRPTEGRGCRGVRPWHRPGSSRNIGGWIQSCI
jgi:hypothetical protein